MNGEYRGLYLVCEQIEVGKNRVEIEDSLEISETGYLIELDARAPDEGVLDRDYFYSKSSSLPYAIKSPDTENEKFGEQRVDFIKSYLDLSYDAILSGDYERVCEYLDMMSFVDGYILDELFSPVDIGFSSFYMYKDAGGKLSRGPIWDYDLSSGNTEEVRAAQSDKIYSGEANPWYAALLTYPQFRAAVGERIAAKKESIAAAIDNGLNSALNNRASFERNFVKWDVLGDYCMGYTSREVCEIDTFGGQIDYLREWLFDSLEFLSSEYFSGN